MGKRTNSFFIRSLSAVALASVLPISACSRQSAEKEPVVPVQTAVAQRATIREVVSSEAILFPLHEAALTPKINAPVRRFYVNRGSHVHRGQLLAVLENRDLAAAQLENQGAYQQAQAEYQKTTASALPQEIQKAKLDFEAARQALEAQRKLYESRQNLYKQGALPRKELDQAAVALTQARNQYKLSDRNLKTLESGGAQQQRKSAAGQLTAAEGKFLGSAAQLAYSQIRSPINGVVTDRPAYPGETAPPGTPLITVMDTSQVIAHAHIPQDEAALLRVGDSATISASGVEAEAPGKVTLVSPAVDPNSTTVEVWVQAPNPDGRLRPGTTVHLTMVAKTVPNATVIPASAVLNGSEGEKSVMVVGADGRAHRAQVDVGIRQGDELQITKGIQAGERVITAGAYGLPDNTKVKEESNQQAGRAGDKQP